MSKLKVGLIIYFTSFASFTTVLFTVFLVLRECNADNLVEYYEELIINGTAEALNYKLSEDARIYQVSDDTPIDFGSYDFVVIGAGSSGSVIANRLSEINQWTVLLLEAGNFTNDLIEIPALYSLGVFSDYNWGFRSIPQKTACLGTVNEQCLIPRGRGIGGTSLINGLMYSRGHPKDFDKWADLVGDQSWSYENVLEYFKKSEDFHQTDPDAPVDWRYHGVGGYLHVEHHKPPIQLTQTFLEANEELGYNITDYNSADELGASIVQYNTKQGKRFDQGTAFVLSVQNRNNLKVMIDSYVTKIEINNNTKEATGVIFTHEGKTYRVAANKEVILSAGVVSNPQLLMLSGIGPKEHLVDLGIPVIENLAVGSVFRDHVSPFGIQLSSNMSSSKQTLSEQIKDYLNGFGDLTTNSLSHVIGFYKSRIEETLDYPDIEIVIDLTSPGTQFGKRFLNWKNETWDALYNNPNISVSPTVVLLHTHSVGSIRLKSSSPFDYPLIDYNFLTDPGNKDIDALYEGIQLILGLLNTTSFKQIDARLASRPLPACKDFEYLSKDYWYCFMRQTTLGVFHPVGSCPTGTGPATGAVVDSNLKVFGIKNLRVADASVFPFTLSGHPNAACTMVGEKVSDIIKADYSVTN